MKTSMRFFCVIFSTLVAVAIATELPEFIHVCRRNDPNFEACVTESVEYLRPYLMRGVPEYNIPSLEPLLLKELIANPGTGIRVTARDVKAYGASDFTVTKLKVDLDNLRFNVDVKLRNIYMQGNYEVDGKILLLPIRGSGPMSGNFTDCMGSVKVQGELVRVQRDQEDRVKITSLKMKISVGKGALRLENLFGGEKVLGDVVNSAINNNFDTFLKELQPLVEKALSEAFLEIANSIVENFTYRQLFPDN